jgi:hypothetical protein
MDEHNEIEKHLPEWAVLIKELYEEARKDYGERLKQNQ